MAPRFLTLIDRPGFGLSVLFEPRDLWVGVYWTKTVWTFTVYICIIPMLPIKLNWYDFNKLPY